LGSATLIAQPNKVHYDRPEQVQKIEAALLPGETIDAVFDMKGGGTGFIGITSRRVIIYDMAFMRKMKAVVSIPYSRIISVAAQDESGLFTGRGFFSSSNVVLSTSHQSYEFEFRGADKAHIAHDLIVAHMV
jgi:Bacterial PH domain